MPQILIRNVSSEVTEKLKARAKRNSRSLEAELRLILQEAAEYSPSDQWAEVQKVRELFAGRQFDDSALLLREDRDR